MNKHALKPFLRANPKFVNSSDILISSSDHWVMVTCFFDEVYRNPNGNFIGISCFCDSYERFSNLFNVQDENDLYMITTKQLERLFRVGQADLFCTTGEYQKIPIIFRKTEGKMIARLGEPVSQLVQEKLVTNDDYFNYSRNFNEYFQNLMCGIH